MEYLSTPIYATGEEIQIAVKSTFVKTTSAHQDISIIDTEKYGKCLVIDGLIQTAESDHEIYDRALLKKLCDSDRNILILGGGDGYVAEMALKLNPALKVTVVDLDNSVVEICREYLHQTIFDSGMVRLVIGDAHKYLYRHDSETKYDGIICDLTDSPIGGSGSEEEFAQFYSSILKNSQKTLNPGGWVSVQAGSSDAGEGPMDAVNILSRLLLNYFTVFDRADILIPSYGEDWAFLYSINVVNNDNK